MSLRGLFSAAAMIGVLGCSSVSDPSAGTPGTALTTLPRELSSSERQVLASSNAFSFALWNELNKSQKDTNIFVSPLSASFSLGMAMNGAVGKTYEDMRTGLRHGTASLAEIDAGYKSLIGLLSTLDPKVTMEIANSIWYRSNFPFNAPFLDATRTFFDATTTGLDFADATRSLATINGWVSTKTHGKIDKILDEIHDDDVMFLINAIYFKGGWRDRFDAKLTESAPFHSVAGDQPASLMHREATISYTETSAYQAVDLPYGDSAFTMTVILPRPGTSVETVAGSLSAESWNALVTGLHSSKVNLALPKVKLAWERKLNNDLKALGMITPFIANGADFSAMSPRGKDLYISLVKQKAFVDINEDGTEAAAVTVTGISVTSAPVVQQMRVDRPFIFAIRERLTGTILFMGKVVRL
jgi:serpin B